MTIAKALTEKSGGSGPQDSRAAQAASGSGAVPLAVLISTAENLVVLASAGKHDCGKIIRDNAPVWGGKGGGNSSAARVMFPSRESLECFVSYIRQAYGASC
jgi:alanyl-tRNA synthetase